MEREVSTASPRGKGFGAVPQPWEMCEIPEKELQLEERGSESFRQALAGCGH